MDRASLTWRQYRANVWLKPHPAKQCWSAHMRHQWCHCITFAKPSISCLLYFLYHPYITHFLIRRIFYLLVTFKTLKTGTPAYLVDLLQLSTSSTRSATHRRLQVNHSHTAFGRQAFSHSSATVWNSLQSELTSNFDSVEVELNTFKCHLKTHILKKHFNLNP